MKIGIDIDDTLTNTKEQQLIYWKKYVTDNPKEGYTKELPATINDFGDEYVQKFWDKYRDELSFDCTFKDSVSKYLKLIKNDGFTICIVTSRPDKKYKGNLQNRLTKWFKDNDITIDIIYTSVINKGLFCKENDIKILIDDSITQTNCAKEYNIDTILFNNISNYKDKQANTWKDIYNILHQLKREQ